MTTFQFTLLIYATRGVYPDNTTASFQTRVANHMDLKPGAWAVGLCELTYPRPASGAELQPIFCTVTLSDRSWWEKLSRAVFSLFNTRLPGP
jgi:hypothetical protein